MVRISSFVDLITSVKSFENSEQLFEIYSRRAS